ncbi:Undecaprenyl-diphosphatase 1 [Dissostichus eleginoides]|uniref:Undecaprenyl-diphosphatase 1 n=1 Tax=Dissostichus eleginoides TaxID=100907 RepID=A0AAD9BF58_DISEL|nr:Undecaprenyl-diphosphatase 1 [Dissostichus eleginoides]
MLPEPWRSGGPQEINRARRPGFNPWQKEQEQEVRDDLYEDLVVMDQEAEQEENVRQEAISDELGLEAEIVAAGEKRLAEALDNSDDMSQKATASHVKGFKSVRQFGGNEAIRWEFAQKVMSSPPQMDVTDGGMKSVSTFERVA